MIAEAINSIQKGNLKIKVPHWLVQVRIYNRLSELIKPPINNFKVSESPEYLEAEVELEPGIYEIEYALAENAESRLVIIKPGENSDILHKNSQAWKNLQKGSYVLSEDYNEAEINYSDYTKKRRPKSDEKFSAGNNSIFLSVKIPKIYAEELFTNNTNTGFQKIFDLKNETGDSVINFGEVENIKGSSEETYLVFNADLPQGTYILEWSRFSRDKSEAKGLIKDKCSQPVFLHSNWTTNVFITHTRNIPAFSLNITRYGMNSNKNDEAIIAAEAVLETFSQEIKKSIINKEHMQSLLSAESQNPWLGILAAYALIPPDTLFFNERTGDEALSEDEALFNRITDFLKSELPEHPDVGALLLKLDQPAEKPFKNPPLLKIGLKRVQMHAVRYETTVPYNELTDRILNSSLKNGPWVAWEKLYEPSDANASSSQSDSSDKHEPTAGTISNSAVLTSGCSSPKLPVYKISTDVEPDQGSSANTQQNIDTCAVQEASLLNLSQELSKAGNFQDLPSQIAITPTTTLIDFLNTVEGKDISIATNLPLSRVNTALRNIISKKEQLLFNQIVLTDDEKQIIKYAFIEETKRAEKVVDQLNKTPENYSAATESDGSEISQNATASGPVSEDKVQPITIEECISRLYAEANHLSVGFGKVSNSLVNNKGIEFAKRLVAVANELLRQADFTVKTNTEGKILFANGAFLYLISSNAGNNNTFKEDKNINTKEEKDLLKTNQLLWEEVLGKAPLGNSEIPSPVPNNYFNRWNLKKIELYNEELKAGDGKLNILRGIGAPDFNEVAVNEIQSNLSNLSLYAPLFAIDSSEKNVFEEKLDQIIKSMEDALKLTHKS